MPKHDDSNVIKVTCEGNDRAPIEKLLNLQGDLKHLSAERYFKLRSSIVKHGFAFPVHVWQDMGGKLKIVDGHQRLAVVKKMIAEEGFTIEGGKTLPVVIVHADTEERAKELVLAAMSQYGTYEPDQLYRFISEGEMDWFEIKDWAQFPQINMGAMEVGWFDSEWGPKEPSDEDAGEKSHTRLGGEASNVKQVALVFDGDEYTKFIMKVRDLGKHWDLDTVTEVVARAISEAEILEAEHEDA